MARALLRLACGVPHPQEAHGAVVDALGVDGARKALDAVARGVRDLAERRALTLGDVYAAAIRRASREALLDADAGVHLLLMLAALHEAQERGEVPR